MSPDSALGPLSEIRSDDWMLAQAAVTALHDELEAYPKPGLVSSVDSGSHDDMDFALMCRSADSLLQSFAELAAAGREARSFETVLMPLGVMAERRMLLATDGVNTHRGAIFSLGMMVGAIARARSRSPTVSPASVRIALRQEWGHALEHHAHRGAAATSHGARVRRETGRDGARREAALAFPSVFDVGVPTYRQALGHGLDANAASIQTLFALMAVVDDTTVLYRGGLEGNGFVRQAAATFLAAGGCFQPSWRERAEDLHHAFVEMNLSPGGCADLLACSILVSRCSHPDNQGT